MVDALWQDEQVALAAPNADPAVIKVSHIKVACAAQHQRLVKVPSESHTSKWPAQRNKQSFSSLRLSGWGCP
eukprot:1160037-Pelagomonas_calceolata.AAC.7